MTGDAGSERSAFKQCVRAGRIATTAGESDHHRQVGTDAIATAMHMALVLNATRVQSPASLLRRHSLPECFLLPFNVLRVVDVTTGSKAHSTPRRQKRPFSRTIRN